MKKRLFICLFIAFKLASPVSAQTLATNWTVNVPIPEGSPVGLSIYQVLTGFSGSLIADVSVNLNISGGYNGGLVGYLTLQDAYGHTATETLLDHVGTTTGNPLGSSGAGFNVTLSDSGTENGSIHSATGVPTGIWQPDSTSTLDGTFGGMTENGTWTLFLVDLSSGGGTSTLNSWGVDITPTPEPSALAIVGLGLAGILTAGFRRR